MQLTRSQLKEIIREVVRETLTEILSEGLNANRSAVAKNLQEERKPLPTRPPVTRTNNPGISYGQASRPSVPQPQRRMEPKSFPLPEELQSSKFADLFEDTMRTTLQQQLSAEQMSTVPDGATREQVIAAQYSPSELFGEEAEEKWNKLAFMPSRPLPGQF